MRSSSISSILGADGARRKWGRALDNRAPASQNTGMELRDIARLASCPLFKGVEPAALRDSLKSLPHDIRLVPEGSVVLLAGCSYSSLLVLLEGEAYAEMASDEGKTFQIESFRAGEALATAILFSPRRLLPVTVIARTGCRFASLPRDTVITLCLAHREALEALLSEIGTRFDAMTEKLRAAQFITLREKLADWLIRRRDLSGSGLLRVEGSRERLAELFGVARPSLSRELGALRNAGIIDFSGREIRILNESALRRLKNSGGKPARLPRGGTR